MFPGEGVDVPAGGSGPAAPGAVQLAVFVALDVMLDGLFSTSLIDNVLVLFAVLVAVSVTVNTPYGRLFAVDPIVNVAMHYTPATDTSPIPSFITVLPLVIVIGINLTLLHKVISCVTTAFFM